MTFDPAKPFRTRDGREAAIYDTVMQPDGRVDHYGKVIEKNGWASIVVWQQNGKWRCGVDRESGCDLVNVPEKLTFWVNVFQASGNKVFVDDIHYYTEAGADAAQRDIDIPRIGPARKVEIEI